MCVTFALHQSKSSENWIKNCLHLKSVNLFFNTNNCEERWPGLANNQGPVDCDNDGLKRQQVPEMKRK